MSAENRARIPIGRANGAAASFVRRAVAVLMVLSLVAVQGGLRADVRAEPADGKIAPWVLANTEPGQQAEFLVMLASRAELGAATGLSSRAEKGRFVFSALRDTAQQEQAGLLAELEALGVPHRSYYIVNAVLVRGDRSLVMDLASRPGVARIVGNPEVRAVSIQAADSRDGPEGQPATELLGSQGIPVNISYVRAPEVWGLGFTGQGIVVGGQDTGYYWQHPALQPHYRGWDGVTVTHDYNWHDAIHPGSTANKCGFDSPVPCDDYGHGTHTMGTAVGSDGGAAQIGMAPGAKWIGCRNMEAGIGTPARYLECFEFFLAPYPVGGKPAEGNPDLAPDVTVNSWSCPAEEGCDLAILQSAVDAQRAAGILTVAAAGNTPAGAGCSSIVDPPGICEGAYTVGALNTGRDDLASFSNRGPVSVDGSYRSKPDLAAPGTNIYSSVPGGGYSSAWSGTSMATPHVAGAVALLWSARPELRGSIADTLAILSWSAAHISSTECSSSGVPNNLYGYGRLDVKSAVDHPALWKGYLPLVDRGALTN